MANTIGTIRRFTANDNEALTTAALRFANRHLATEADSDHTWHELQLLDDSRLRRLWQACLCRALRVPVSADITVAHGYVAYHVR